MLPALELTTKLTSMAASRDRPTSGAKKAECLPASSDSKHGPTRRHATGSAQQGSTQMSRPRVHWTVWLLWGWKQKAGPVAWV